ncbi:DNA polymerase III subunit gamma and tau [Zhihengliuella salsuginis]|uniref:DNA-directed DNA polymerase n=1 Tax=Zhihengliuella salsuginis TaxID=578222 RepID=A0ABQ3GBT8_9MICC|nr:DNA polymerase III subunit gamma and tau [Zhihengliuella salsuginis]GHC99972.1 hypothetical protein GCM10008096_02690 [Zhihengliuella salsuginis]
MSTALYRRYRPDTFADVIGQEHVTTPLMAALEKNRVNHAYLFSGPRGCGKTTSARILARCLNCEQGPTANPCGTCASCTDLATGGPGSLDVIEIDAASHGGVDDARDLRERATFAPTRDRYKIFIIDEAHMVTSAGFNALLKIVEEPPEHIKFIFATTEPDKVIGTIRSRTHHYPFRLVPPETLIEYLERLCQQENVPVAPGVLSLVLRAGGGSVRDTLSVLDQLMAGAGAEGLDYELAVSLLGYTHATLLDDVVDALAAQDAATVFGVVDRVIQTGHDPRRFVEDLLERLRDLIIVKAMPDNAAQIIRGLPADQLARMQQQAVLLGQAELSRSADVTNQALTEMTGATSPRLHLELLCARLLLPASDTTERGIGARVDRIERRLTHGGDAPLAAGPAPADHDAGTGAAPAADPGMGGIDANGASGAAAVREALRKARHGDPEPQPQPAEPAEPAPASQAQAPQAEPVSAAPAPAPAEHPAPEVAAAPEPAAASTAADAEQPAGDAPKDGPAFPKTAAELAARLPSAARKPATPGEDPTADWGGTWTVPDPDESGTAQPAGSQQPSSPADAPLAGPPQQGAAPAPQPQPGPALANEPQQARPQPPQQQAGPPTTEHAQPTAPARSEADGPATPATQQPAPPAPGADRPAAPAPARDQAQPSQPERPQARPEAPTPPPQESPAPAPAAPETGGGTGSIEMFRRAWPEVLELVKNERKAVWMNLQQNATLAGFDGRSLAVSFSNPGAQTNFLNRPDNVAMLQWAINQVLGMQVNVDIVAGGSAPAGGSGPKAERRPQPASAGPAPVAPQQAPGPFRPAPQRQEHYERPAAPEWSEFPPAETAGSKNAASDKPAEPGDATGRTTASSGTPAGSAGSAGPAGPVPTAGAPVPVAEQGTAQAAAPAPPAFEGDRGSAVSPVEAAGPRGHSSRSAVSADSAHSAHSAASSPSANTAGSAASAPSAGSADSAPSAASAPDAEPAAETPTASPAPDPSPASASAPAGSAVQKPASEWDDQHWDEPDDGWVPPEEPPPFDDPGPEPEHQQAAAAPAPAPARVVPPAPAGPTPPPPSWAGSALPATMRPDPAKERPAAPAPERQDPAKKLSRYQQLLAQAQGGGAAPGAAPTAPAPGPAADRDAPGAGAPPSYPQNARPAGANPNQGGQPVNSSYGAGTDADFVPSDDDIAIEDSTVIGRAAIEHILNGRLIEERNNDGTPIS